MRGNWVFFIVIFFFIIRLFTAAAKKQATQAKQSDTDRLQKALAERAQRNRVKESDDNVRTAAEVLRARSQESRPRRSASAKEDFESAYKSQEYQENTQAPAPAPDYTAQFGAATGVTESTYKESAEERAAYDASGQPAVRLLAKMTTGSYRQFIIAKEIFDKPKSMR